MTLRVSNVVVPRRSVSVVVHEVGQTGNAMLAGVTSITCQPSDIMADRRGTGLDAAVILVEGRNGSEAGGGRIGE